MPETLLQAQERFRRAMLARDARTLRELTSAYRSAYAIIKRDADRLLENGETINPFWLLREERYRSLLMQVQKRINEFSDIATGKITAAQSELARLGVRSAMASITASLPPEVAAAFDLLPARAINSLVGVLSDGSPLADLLGELGPQARELIGRTLINGVASGMPIRQIAKGMKNALGQNLSRALNISRTESLRAYREGSRETYKANDDVVKGWRWLCSFSSRTCPMCFAMHDTEHTNDESLDSHPSCRCTMAPITKSFRELGIAVDEPKIDFGDSEKWIRSQPAAIQEQIFGKAGYQAFRDGKVRLDDFVGEKVHPRWGMTRYTKPVSKITRRRKAA